MTANESTADAIEPAWVEDVIQFWFEELTEADWFAKSDELDARIRDRFLAVHEQIVRSGGIEILASRPLLAAVIVVDQFSRNMFRGTAARLRRRSHCTPACATCHRPRIRCLDVAGDAALSLPPLRAQRGS